MKPLISVIVPVYNCEKVLRRCLDSIISQTYENLQIILVNDGSKDNSEEICKEYKNRDSRIELISIKNLGSSGARNVGLKNVRGEYLTFIDSDDFVSIYYVNKLYSLLEKNNADISVCNYIYFDKEIPTDSILSDTYELYETPEKIEKILLSLYEDNLAFIVPWGKLFKRNLFTQIFFPEGKCFDDQATIYKTYLKSKVIVYNNSKLYFYYRNEQSISNTIYLKNPQDFFPIYEERIKLYSDYNYELARTQTELEYFSALAKYCCVNKDYLNLKRMKQLAKVSIHNNISIKTKIKYVLFLLFPYLIINYLGAKEC